MYLDICPGTYHLVWEGDTDCQVSVRVNHRQVVPITVTTMGTSCAIAKNMTKNSSDLRLNTQQMPTNTLKQLQTTKSDYPKVDLIQTQLHTVQK